MANGRAGLHSVNTQRPRQVLDRSLPHVLEVEVELAFHLLECRGGEPNLARAGEGLDARGDVHAVARDALAVDDQLADVDTDAKRQRAPRGQLLVPRRQARLDRHGARHRIDHAAELGEQVVTDRIDHAPVMLANQGRHRIAMRLEGAEGRHLVGGHQSTVTDRVGAEDRRKLALRKDCLHGSTVSRRSTGSLSFCHGRRMALEVCAIAVRPTASLWYARIEWMPIASSWAFAARGHLSRSRSNAPESRS